MTLRIESSEQSTYREDAPEIPVHDIIAQFDKELAVFDGDMGGQFPDPTEEELAVADAIANDIETLGDAEETTIQSDAKEMDDMPPTVHPIDLYLAEIKRFPMLSKPEKQYHMGCFTKGRDALRSQARSTKRSSKRTIELNQLVQNGWISRDILIESHLALVVSIAKKYQHRGVPFLDLINAGNIGLIRSLYKFDPKKKYALSTYATFWIRQAVLKEISDSSRTIHMAENTENDVAHMVYMINRFVIEHGREPTDKEIAKKLKKKITRIRELKGQMKQPISLETPFGMEDDAELGEFLSDPEAPSIEASVSTQLFESLFKEVLSTLTAEERRVISLLYSPNNKAVSINSIARTMGMSTYIVKELLTSAKTKIAAHANAEALHDYIR